MPAFILTLATVLSTFGIVAVVLLAVVVLTLLMDWYTMTPFDHLIRDRRRHTERTARAMRRMTKICSQTAERMDRAERERWR